jgi:adenine-specific DNA-methyltransferase
LTWPNKDKFLLSPSDESGKPVWVERTHPAANEVRLTNFKGQYGEVNESDPYVDNLLFTGDSLDVLRVLTRVPEFARHYRGKVKLIYLDPPFNTGTTFEHYDDWMEHSTWLSFMRDRLLLAKELLSHDGSIWMHWDDVEIHRMRLVMDEVFGSANFVASVIWEKTYAPRNDAKQFSTSHDQMLVYSRQPSWITNRLSRTEDNNSGYKNPDNDERGSWMSGDYTSNKTRDERPNLWYPIHRPGDGAEIWPAQHLTWRYQEATHEENERNNKVWWGKDGLNTVPRLKRFLSEVPEVVPQTVWAHVDVGHTDSAKKEMKALFPQLSSLFSTPKPERLLERIIHIASNPGDIVLDCFAGSGTTAAVAQKMGRRWVTAELSPNTVNTFTRPRLEKVISGDDQGGISQSVEWQGGGGFRTVEIAPSAYADTPVGVMLEPWVLEGDLFARLMAGQLGFIYEPSDPFVGHRGRMRLATFPTVGIEEASVALSALDASERVTIVGTVILDGVEAFVRENSRGSRVMKAPRDVLRPHRKRKRENA